VWQNSRAFAVGYKVNFIRGATHHLQITVGPRIDGGSCGSLSQQKVSDHMFTVRHFYLPKGGVIDTVVGAS
jgi:hypothetical protein